MTPTKNQITKARKSAILYVAKRGMTPENAADFKIAMEKYMNEDRKEGDEILEPYIERMRFRECFEESLFYF